MKAVNFMGRILKAAILLLVASTLSFAQQKALYETKRKSVKRVYNCKQVGIQKVSSKKIKSNRKNNKEQTLSIRSIEQVKDSIKPVRQEVPEELYVSTVSTELYKVEKEVEETHVIPLPQPVYFRFDTDELTYEDLHQIALAIEHLRAGKNIILEGHTDSHGSNAYNMELSMKRANKIKKLILESAGEGVNESAIAVRYYGEEKPVVDNNSDENRQLNRRVEFIVL